MESLLTKPGQVTVSQKAVVSKDIADPLPYIVIFLFLFIISLVVLTWMLDVWYKSQQCTINPNIWCSDSWTCNNSCGPNPQFSPCFDNPGLTGLASCLYGPGVTGATLCLATPTTGTGAVSCECVPGIDQATNCFSNCASNFGDMDHSTTTCCCKPGSRGCPWVQGHLPAICQTSRT